MFEDIAAELKERTFQEGEVLLEEGTETRCVYILKGGAVVVTIEDDEVCRVCTPETVFGEVSVLLETESTATVKALEPTTVWVVEDLDSFMDSHPKFSKIVARDLARRLCSLNLDVMEARVSMQQLEARFLELNADSKTTEVGKADIAKLKQETTGSPAKTPKLSVSKRTRQDQPPAIRGLIQKVNKLLQKRIF